MNLFQLLNVSFWMTRSKLV